MQLCGKDQVNMINDPTRWVEPTLIIMVWGALIQGRQRMLLGICDEWRMEVNKAYWSCMLFLVFGVCNKNKPHLTTYNFVQGRGEISGKWVRDRCGNNGRSPGLGLMTNICFYVGEKLEGHQGSK